MSKYWNIDHPVLPRVSMEAAVANAQPGESTQQCWERLNRERDQFIDRETEDPLRFGYEPPVWKIADAVIEWPWIDHGWAAVTRHKLGIPKAVDVALINGGYRGGKTDYMGKRSVQLMLHQKARVWCFITSLQQSLEVQQPVIWKYLPPKYKGRDIRTKVAYLAYRMATGFSENRFTLENGSWCSFRTYNQEEDNVEGAAPKLVWCDEPPDQGLIKALTGRIAENNGKLVMTFAPKHGFTGVVRDYVNDATATADSTAFLLPADGGAPDVEAALRGETPEEWGMLDAAGR